MAGFAAGGVLLAAAFALALGVTVQLLWNWLMPEIFGFKEISYWQAFGLLFLGRLLFGGFRHHPPSAPSTTSSRRTELTDPQRRRSRNRDGRGVTGIAIAWLEEREKCGTPAVGW